MNNSKCFRCLEKCTFLVFRYRNHNLFYLMTFLILQLEGYAHLNPFCEL